MLWNIAAAYSHMGAAERKWTLEGKKKAAAYLQLSAGYLLHIRDMLIPQFKFDLGKRADLSEVTLTTVATLMLAQAAECFYEKANGGMKTFIP